MLFNKFMNPPDEIKSILVESTDRNPQDSIVSAHLEQKRGGNLYSSRIDVLARMLNPYVTGVKPITLATPVIPDKDLESLMMELAALDFTGIHSTILRFLPHNSRQEGEPNPHDACIELFETLISTVSNALPTESYNIVRKLAEARSQVLASHSFIPAGMSTSTMHVATPFGSEYGMYVDYSNTENREDIYATTNEKYQYITPIYAAYMQMYPRYRHMFSAQVIWQAARLTAPFTLKIDSPAAVYPLAISLFGMAGASGPCSTTYYNSVITGSFNHTTFRKTPWKLIVQSPRSTYLCVETAFEAALALQGHLTRYKEHLAEQRRTQGPTIKQVSRLTPNIFKYIEPNYAGHTLRTAHLTEKYLPLVASGLPHHAYVLRIKDPVSPYDIPVYFGITDELAFTMLTPATPKVSSFMLSCYGGVPRSKLSPHHGTSDILTNPLSARFPQEVASHSRDIYMEMEVLNTKGEALLATSYSLELVYAGLVNIKAFTSSDPVLEEEQTDSNLFHSFVCRDTPANIRSIYETLKYLQPKPKEGE